MHKILQKLKRTGRRAREIVGSRLKGGAACGTCGFVGSPLHRDVLWPGLIAEWELTPEWTRWMNQREGSRCAWCGSSLRSGQLARAIVDTVNARTGTSATHLSELFRDARARNTTIAEINSAGNLHRYLARCPGLRHSEFGSVSATLPSEDLDGTVVRRRAVRSGHHLGHAGTCAGHRRGIGRNAACAQAWRIARLFGTGGVGSRNTTPRNIARRHAHPPSGPQLPRGTCRRKERLPGVL